MKHIFAAGIIHESHGFNRIPTEIDRFDVQLGTDIRRHATGDSEFSGLFDIASEENWHLTHPVRAYAEPSGVVTRACFETLWQLAEHSMRSDGPFDGVFWVLHGAMSVEGIDDVEGEILSRTRSILGRDVPMAVTLDIHAIVTPRMVMHSDIICGYHTTPHVDLRETARRAARLLQRALKGEIKPVTYSIHPPVLIGLDHGRTTTDSAPIPRLLNDFRERQTDAPCLLDASFFAGFPYGNFRCSGASAVIVVDGACAAALTSLDHYGEQIIRTRNDSTVHFASMKQAIELARSTGGDGPFLIGDFTDTPHGGAYGDSPNALRTLLEMGVSNAALGLVWDPATVDMAHAAGVGGQINISLGGHASPELGAPLDTCAIVTGLSGDGQFVHKGPFANNQAASMGRSAALCIHGIEVAVSEIAYGIVDREQFRILGIQPDDKDIIVVKTYNHFRADFEPIGRGLVYADTGGLMTLDFARFNYDKVRRPIWPLDDIGYEEGCTLRARTGNPDGW